MVQLTVFTPTYNRIKLLQRCFEALQRQSSKDFLWLIIDDGSADDTGIVVEEWQKQIKSFEIRYVYKENGGLHTGYNKAIELLDTELAMCVDSDDYLPDDAVERILNFWNKYGSDRYAGIVGLNCTSDGKVIGDPLPQQKSMNLIDLAIGKYPIQDGDRKNIIRSALYKAVAPMQTYEGEKFFNPHYMHLEISKKYDFLVLNENLCYVEYQPGGMSDSIFLQYYNSPQSFSEIRKLALSFKGTSWVFRFRQYIHYASSCYLAGKDLGLQDVNKFMLLLSWPLGGILSLVIRFKNRRKVALSTTKE